MLSNIIKVLIIISIIAGVGYAAITVYSCVTHEPDTGLPDMPDASEAQYGVHIENSGNLLLTNEYEIYGTEIGSRVIVLQTFWEVSGSKFKYRPTPIVLEEKIFGKITIRRR